MTNKENVGNCMWRRTCLMKGMAMNNWYIYLWLIFLHVFAICLWLLFFWRSFSMTPILKHSLKHRRWGDMSRNGNQVTNAKRLINYSFIHWKSILITYIHINVRIDVLHLQIEMYTHIDMNNQSCLYDFPHTSRPKYYVWCCVYIPGG